MRTFYVVYKDKYGDTENMTVELNDITKVNLYTIKRAVIKNLMVWHRGIDVDEDDITIISWQETEEMTNKEWDRIEKLKYTDHDRSWSFICGDYDNEIFKEKYLDLKIK